MIMGITIIVAMGITIITMIKAAYHKLGLLPPRLEGWGGGGSDRMPPPCPSPASGGGGAEALAFAYERQCGAMQ
jgi:hypothetical protein